MKKIYELPFLEINRFELDTPILVDDPSRAGYDDEEIEDEE